MNKGVANRPAVIDVAALWPGSRRRLSDGQQIDCAIVILGRPLRTLGEHSMTSVTAIVAIEHSVRFEMIS